MSRLSKVPTPRRRWLRCIRDSNHFGLFILLQKLKAISTAQWDEFNYNSSLELQKWHDEQRRRQRNHQDWSDRQIKHRRQDVIKPTKQRRF